MQPSIIKRENQNGKRRHCMVVHAYYPLGETRVERQALALMDQGIEVDVYCLKEPGGAAREIIEGINVYRLPVRRHRGSGVFIQLIEYLTFFVLALILLTKEHIRNKYNVVQVHNLPDFLVFVAILPKLTKGEVILDLHDLMPEFYAERFEMSMDSLPVRLVSWQEKVSCRFADHIICVTEIWKQTLVRRGYSPEKITVVMNVADDQVFIKDQVMNIPDEGRFKLIYHGVMGYRNGLDLVINAINNVKDVAPNIQLVLHGNGEYLPTLEKMVGQLGLHDHVTISTDFVVTEELVVMIKEANVGIAPYRDGIFTGGILPTKMMEYAALGIPVIAARTPSIDAYFDETMVAFFAPEDVEGLANCILSLYNDRERLTQMSLGIQKFNQQHNWSKEKETYLSLVKKLGSTDFI